MKNTLRIVTAVAILGATPVLAASGTKIGGIGLIGWLFIGFFAAIVVFQLIPSLALFGSMMAAIFGKAVKQGKVTDSGKSGN